ncbi:MAG: TatD family hydrolase [Vicinamibacterales bacterium]
MIDSHCHLAGEEFAGDLPAVVERAVAAGLRHVLVILAADDDAEIERGHRVAALWEAARFAIGVHPHAAARYSADPTAAPRAVERAFDALPASRAVGEISLDYYYDFAPVPIQQHVFREQIRLARRRTLPIVIHTRDAEDDTFRILGEESASEVGGVFHCFTGDRAMARRALDIGFHVSLAGIVTFPRALELKEVARLVPLDRLLIETDSPFLAPVPFRGTRNEPSYVTRVAEVVGELRGTGAGAIGEAARENYERLFKP